MEAPLVRPGEELPLLPEALIVQIVQSVRQPLLDGGRNIRLGHLRGWGLEFGGLGPWLADDPCFRTALALGRERQCLLAESKLQNIFLIIKYCLDGVEGDIVEFGSYRGGSAVFIGAVLKQLGRSTRVYALDSYGGMPETDPVRDLHQAGDFMDARLDELQAFLRGHDLEQTVLPVKGRFEDTFPRLAPRIGPVSLVHVDCDIYTAVQYAIVVAKSRLRHDGYLVFDDPLHGSCLGAMQAIEEDLYHREKLRAEQTYPHLVFRYPPITVSRPGPMDPPTNGRPLPPALSELARLARRIEALQADSIVQRDAAARERLRALEDRDRALRQSQAAEAERDAARSAHADAVSARDAAVSAREAALAERDVARQTWRSSLVERDAALQARDGAFAERDAALARWDLALQARNDALRRRDAALAAVRAYEDSLAGALSALGLATGRSLARAASGLRRTGAHLAWRGSRFVLRILPVDEGARWRLKGYAYGRWPALFAGTPGHAVWVARTRPARLTASGAVSESAEAGAAPGVPIDLEALSAALHRRTRAARFPAASIIIPVHGQVGYTLRCLQSIAASADAVPFEIIVVDDASPDRTREILRRLRGVRVVENDRNLGFIRSSNAGAAAAFGEHLVFLNNDTEVRDGWLDELVQTFAQVPDAGLVGSKLIYPDGRLQEAGGVIWNDGTAWNFGRNEDPDEPRFNYLRAVDYCSGASLAVSRRLFKELGGFDEHYAPAYGEDSDLAFKVRQAGRRVYYQPLSVVVHHEGVTSGVRLDSGPKAHQVENTRKLFARWSREMADLQAPGVEVDRAKDRGVQGRVLVLDHCTPTPDQDAGSITALNIMRLVQAHGYQVTFIPEDNFHYLPGYTADLQRIGIEVLYAPGCTSVSQHLAAQADRYDAVLIFRPGVAQRHLHTVKTHCPRARVIYHTSDLHYLRMHREAALQAAGEDAGLRVEAEAMRELELAIMRRVHAVIVHSTYEAHLLETEHGLNHVHVFPWAIETPGTRVGHAARRDLCFVGGYQHQPNVDAVEFFVSRVFPRIRQALPEVRFHVIGSNPPDRLKALEGDGVVLTGFVKDLGAVLERMRVAVAPLRYGAGIKGKIGTTLAAGLPCVATSLAAEGMGLADGREILLADEPAAFAAAVIGLYVSADRWMELSEAGAAFARRTYGFDRAIDVMGDILRRAGLEVRTAASSAQIRARRPSPPAGDPPSLSLESSVRELMQSRPFPDVAIFDSMEAYQAAGEQRRKLAQRRGEAERNVPPADPAPFTLPGYCAICRTPGEFAVDYRYAMAPADGARPVPHWREQLVCRGCGLNNRVRAALHVFEAGLRPEAGSRIYATERDSALLAWLKDAYPETRGRDDADPDLARLNGPTSRLDFILSFEALAYTPDYRSVLREFFRRLKPDGRLLLTAPFRVDQQHTLTRARPRADGGTEHLAAPEYHDDSGAAADRLLCYHHFGWDLLDVLRGAGAREAQAITYYSFEGGNLGHEQWLFFARR